MSDDGNILKILPNLLEYDVRINVRNLRDSKDIEDPVFSHRLILSSASVLFRDMLSLTNATGMASIDVDVRTIPNGLAAFKAVISSLYSGQISFEEAEAIQILWVARMFQIPSAESKVLTNALELNPLSMLLHTTPLFNQATQLQQYLQSLMTICMQPGLLTTATTSATSQSSLSSSRLVPTPLLTPPSSVEDVSVTDGQSLSPVLSPPSGLAPTEKIVPNDDKEGWCRNKKYIEKVDKGFMCTVCRKVYGRYNSVSYHVTIYHRNPPIKCEEPGCQFSTREARYIHFHKYYRHQIPLPDTIDLGSRKCPFCRHVSKSPAMLEKHIARHEAERKDQSNHNCDQCLFRGKTAQMLHRHKQFSHSGDVYSPSYPCSFCSFITTSESALLVHLASHVSLTEGSLDIDNNEKSLKIDLEESVGA
ncbi:unnamed protein product [Auanema sp. JU1783]|nr:unnamed protein product [Auanema sp. JU1783]